MYLTSQYERAFATFLGACTKDVLFKSKCVSNLSKKKIYTREKFLEHEIKLGKRHWCVYWQLITYPEVLSIVFDKNMKYAKIFFCLFYVGGEAILKQEDGKWKMQSSNITWVE